jgi:hypothetical protein
MAEGQQEVVRLQDHYEALQVGDSCGFVQGLEAQGLLLL